MGLKTFGKSKLETGGKGDEWSLSGPSWSMARSGLAALSPESRGQVGL
jgi:hypothetical protein